MKMLNSGMIVVRFAIHKITPVVFFLGILFDIHFVSFRCEGAALLSGQNTRVVSPGSDVEILWSFNDDIDKVVIRSWRFVANGKGVDLARIYGIKGRLEKVSTLLSGVEVNETGKMVLRNVNGSYHGAYSFQVAILGSSSSSIVHVYVAGPLKITVCSSPITVNESTNVACMCKAERDSTPEPPSVAWYDEDGNQIGDVGKGMNELKLNNIKRNQTGRYTCKADSYGLKNETSIQVNLYLEKTSTPKPLTFKTSGTAEKTITPKPLSFKTSGTAAAKASTPKSRTFKTSGTDNSKANCNKADGGTVVVWHIVVSLVAGFITGFLFSYIVVWSRRRFRKRKPPSKPEPETPKDNSIYQELDLTKMNSEDSYQSLRGNDAKNDAAGPEQDDDGDIYQNIS